MATVATVRKLNRDLMAKIRSLMKARKMSGQHWIHFFCSRSCICSETTLLTLLLFPKLRTWRMCVALVLSKLHLWTTLSRVLLCFNLRFSAWWHLFLRKKNMWWTEWVQFPTEILAFFTTPALSSSSLQCLVPLHIQGDWVRCCRREWLVSSPPHPYKF